KTLLKRFLNGIGGFTDQVNTYSNAAGTVILPYVVGNAEAIYVGSSWDGLIRDSELIVMFGGAPLKNLQVAGGGPGMHMGEEWLRRAKEAGIEFVNIAPLRDDAADFLGAEWIHPRPNTDTALMLGMAHTLAEEGLHDPSFLKRYCTGYDRFESYLMGGGDGQPKDADWAASITNVGAGRIRALARRMAASRTMIMTNWSLQRADHGEQPFWMTITLAAMLGQIGLPGSGFGFGYGSMCGMGGPRERIATPRMHAGRNPTGSFIPVARISDMLLNPGGWYEYNGEARTFPDIRLVYWCGGNPFHHHQDINRLLRAWRRPETIVVHEPWWTATARHADIVLPATTTLERNDIGASPKDRFILAMEKAIEPIGEARNDFDIFVDLAGRLGTREAFDEGLGEMDWLRRIYEDAREQAAERLVDYPGFNAFWEKGHVEIPAPVEPYVMHADFRADPAGKALNTPSGKIEIFSETIDGFGYEDCPGHPAWLEPIEWLGGDGATNYPLHMISNQPATRLHGQMDSAGISRKSKIKGREPVRLHPADAARRGISEGDIVRIFNGRGEILAGAVLTDRVRTGVIQISTGAWYDPVTPGRVGALDRHGNPNVLTPDKGTSRLGQGPIALSALVEVERFEGELPEITIFRAPGIMADAK
ncbi:MAG TPA: Asp-tRNA(Asn)/Glu-tRNA(Gln) amidotransferase GatCAB subunit C, partial [Nitrospinae bacterium]|nr:Asp-tRNA(Asn)/Glu-tRNA(Gln) amidotransferase GatCAB subunit C [Nitrospinota bacterium]